jgi:endonuclease YncB( thermonuclease family)
MDYTLLRGRAVTAPCAVEHGNIEPPPSLRWHRLRDRQRYLLSGLLLVTLLVAHGPLWADESGRIVGVIDGDTVDLLTDSRVLIRVRLSGIDAPEKKQAFGNVAKRALSDLAFNRTALVIGHKLDRFGRLVGKISVAGTDVNLRLVQLGLAWHFKKYEREQEPVDRQRYAQAELGARAKRVGLWADKEPVAPWDFRASRHTTPRKGKWTE